LSPPHRASGGDNAAFIRQRERSCYWQLTLCTFGDAAHVRRGAPRRTFPVRSKPIGPGFQRAGDGRHGGKESRRDEDTQARSASRRGRQFSTSSVPPCLPLSTHSRTCQETSSGPPCSPRRRC
jgi:hypothetical protein